MGTIKSTLNLEVKNFHRSQSSKTHTYTCHSCCLEPWLYEWRRLHMHSGLLWGVSFQLDFNDSKLWGYFVPRCYKMGGWMKICLSGSSYRLPTEKRQQLLEGKKMVVKALGGRTKRALFHETQRGHIKTTIKNLCSSTSNLLGIKQQGWICGGNHCKSGKKTHSRASSIPAWGKGSTHMTLHCDAFVSK